MIVKKRNADGTESYDVEGNPTLFEALIVAVVGYFGMKAILQKKKGK